MKLDYLQFLELEVFTRFGTKLEPGDRSQDSPRPAAAGDPQAGAIEPGTARISACLADRV